jgi:hypothetical protein
MRLSIVGCPDKERFRPYVKRAIEFYAHELLSSKMIENINLKVKFDKTIVDVYGYASVEVRTDNGKARDFLIEMNPKIGGRNILKSLAHEMVHIKQYAYDETNDNLTRWKGIPIDGNFEDYWRQPWEIEAYGIEAGLFRKFVVEEKLWEVFENISDPDSPIEEEPIGWKYYSES